MDIVFIGAGVGLVSLTVAAAWACARLAGRRA